MHTHPNTVHSDSVRPYMATPVCEALCIDLMHSTAYPIQNTDMRKGRFRVLDTEAALDMSALTQRFAPCYGFSQYTLGFAIIPLICYHARAGAYAWKVVAVAVAVAHPVWLAAAPGGSSVRHRDAMCRAWLCVPQKPNA
jgi:hypothetical protein